MLEVEALVTVRLVDEVQSKEILLTDTEQLLLAVADPVVWLG